MPQSCNITAEMIKALRDRTGAGMQECKNALVRCEGDELLAEGWLLYHGRALNTYDLLHEDWAMQAAQGYKERVLKDPSTRMPHHLESLQNQ